MQYEKFESKIQKIADVLKLAFKHITKIIVSLSIVFVAVLGLLIAKGTVVGADSCPDEIEYGEALKYEAKGFMSKVFYEYAEADSSDWSTEFPEDPGEYKVRAVGKATIGYRYGKPEYFVLKPREIDVKIVASSLVHGELPEIVADTINGDEISCSAFIYTDDEARIEPDPKAIKVVDQYGKNITKRYSFNTEVISNNKQPRPITIVTPDAEKIYDGNALDNLLYSVTDGSVADGDTLVIKSAVAITDVGSAKNSFEIVFVRADGKDVTKFYDIEMIEGTLTVLKRPVTLCSSSGTFVYSGEDHQLSSPSVSTPGEVLQTHSIVATGWKKHIDVGEYTNSFTAQILDASGEDVSGNYQINYSFGTVTVTKRAITVTSPTESRMYSGYEWMADDLACDNLAVGDKITVLSATSIKNVGTVENAVEFTLYNTSRSCNVAANYEITVVFGSLTVTQRPLRVQSLTQSWIYDALPHYTDTVNCISGDYEGLAGIDRARVLTYTELTNVDGPHVNEITVGIFSGSTDVTANYDISYEFGTVEILPRPIVIHTASDSKYYDGMPFSCPEVELVQNIVDGHKVVVDSSVSITDAEAVPNEIYSYDIVDENGQSVKSNYVEEGIIYGILEVIPRPVIFVTGSAEKIYDATPLRDSSIGVSPESEFDLVAGHRYETSAPYGSITDAGTAWNYHDGVVNIYDASGENVNRNYNVTVLYGTLTVIPRPVVIVTGKIEAIYDAKPHSNPSATVVIRDGTYGLCSGHSIRVTSYSSFEDVISNGLNDLTVSIYSGYRDVSRNYEIIYEYGSVNIYPRPITFKSGDITHTYDDSYVYNYDVRVSGGYGLCSGHDFFTLGLDGYRDVIIDGDNLFECVIMSGDRDVTFNYDVTYEYGRVNIYPRPITIVTESYNGIYDGYYHASGAWMSKGSLCYNHFIEFDAFPGFRDVVYDVENVRTARIFIEESGELRETTSNYEITYEYGRVTIAHRVIKITTGSKSWVYDGEPHKYEVYTIVEGTLADGQKAKIKESTEIIEIGAVANWIYLEIVDAEHNAVTDNYDIQYESVGILEIIGDTENPDDSGDSGGSQNPPKLDESGDIGLPPGGGGGGGGGGSEPVVVYVIKSDTTGNVYLKVKSFGTYTGRKWEEAVEYGEHLAGYSSPCYLPASALEYSGATVSNMLITSKNGQYVLPYFTSDATQGLQSSDVYVNGDASETYSVYYYSVNGSYSGYVLPSGLNEYELAYRDFVYAQYLQIDDETRAYMNGIIFAENFDINDPDVINKVASYIQSAATYSLDYNRDLDAEDNIAIAFLDEYKEGICQHYATSATMLFRALGLPARYTIGFVGDTVAGEETEVTADKGHAWVEVYIAGFGWVNVEVTGGGGGGGEAPDNSEGQNILPVIPVAQSKPFDGTPLYAENVIDESAPLVEALLNRGFTYEVVVSGSQTECGVGTSVIESFILYDPDGNDVTANYNIVFGEGTLTVYEQKIQIYLYEKHYEYSGKEVTYKPDDYLAISVPDGVTLVIEGINISMKNIGSLTSSQINQSVRDYIDYKVYVDGVEMDPDNYMLEVVNYDGGEYTPLKITPRTLHVATASASKEYDGRALEAKSFYITMGALVEGDTLTMDVLGSIISIGVTPNTINLESVTVKDASGRNVTVNYEIEITLGELEIT